MNSSKHAPLLIRWLPVAVLLLLTVYLHQIVLAGKIGSIDLERSISLGFMGVTMSYKALLMNLFYVAIILPCVALIEIASSGFRQSSIHKFLFNRQHSHSIDLVLFLFYWVRFSKVLTAVFTVGILYAFQRYLPRIYNPEDNFFSYFMKPDQYVAALVAYFIVWSFTDYWNHRLYHNALMWPIHRLHHSAEDLTIFTAYRNHPSAAILDPITKILPMMLLGVPPEMVTIIIYFNASYQLLAHSNIQSDWGWFGRWIFISPLHHRLHHSALPDHYGKNLGVLTIWDHLFGTYMEPPKRIEAVGVVLARYKEEHVFRIFYADLVEFLGNCKRLLKRQPLVVLS